MQRELLLFLGIFGVLINGCSRRNLPNEVRVMQAAHQAVPIAILNSTNETCRVWQDFWSRWPLAKQQNGLTWEPENGRFTGHISGATLIEKRYVFSMSFRYEISTNLTDAKFKTPDFSFYEFSKIIPQRGGGFSISYKEPTYWFKVEDWRKLTNANFDFKVLGIEIRSNAPVANADALPSL
jgi:hypothetical protein